MLRNGELGLFFGLLALELICYLGAFLVLKEGPTSVLYKAFEVVLDLVYDDVPSQILIGLRVKDVHFA